MKKIVVVALLIMVSFLTIACAKKELTLPEKVYQDNPTEVDEGIQEMMDEDEYDSAEYDTKVSLMGELLDLYKKNKQIQYYDYSEESSMYSFTYKDGILGGVKLKPFDPMLN